MHREEGLSFQNVTTFNLDEYYPMNPESLQSYVRFMDEHLFQHEKTPSTKSELTASTADMVDDEGDSEMHDDDPMHLDGNFSTSVFCK